MIRPGVFSAELSLTPLSSLLTGAIIYSSLVLVPASIGSRLLAVFLFLVVESSNVAHSPPSGPDGRDDSWWLVSKLIPRQGKRMASGLRHMGKQAQTIAVLSSMMVHMDEAISSWAFKLAGKNELWQSLEKCGRRCGIASLQEAFPNVLYVHVVSGLVDENPSVLARIILVMVTLHSC